MHYYQFHIGDYRSATLHLSNEEDLAYRRLLDMYYDTEKPIPLDVSWVAKRIKIELSVVRDVLNDMFKQTEDGFIQSRCDKEISVYKGFSDAGKRGAAKRWGKGGDSPPIAPLIATNNHKPITNNHKPNTRATSVAMPDGISQSVWEDFKTLRKAKKAPVTQRVIDGIQEQADLAGWTLEKAMEECCIRGWQSFKAEWVTTTHKLFNKADVVHQTVPSSPQRDPALVKLDEDRLKTAPPNPEVLAKIRAVLGRTA
jgi:uncharacterized protein YdaU (DUF1376 family)